MTDTGDGGRGWEPPPPQEPPVQPPGWQPPVAGSPGTPTTPPPAPPPAPGYPPVPPPAQPYGQGYGQGYASPYPQAPRNEPLAIAGLVCGIVAIPFFCGIGLILGVLGLVFGIVAMKKIDRSGGAFTGRGMALAGAICGGVGVAINVLYWGAVIIVAIADGSS